MKEQLAEEKKKKVAIKVDPQVVDLDDPLNRPLKVILPSGSRPMEAPLPSSEQSVQTQTRRGGVIRENMEGEETEEVVGHSCSARVGLDYVIIIYCHSQCR